MSVLLPSMRGALGGVSAVSPPDIGNRVFWWNSAGDAGGCFTDVAATLPAADNTRVAALKGAEGSVWSQSSATERPLFRLNRQNGLPGLYFERARGDNLENRATSGILAAAKAVAAMTVLMVWRPGAAVASGAFRMNDSSTDGLFIGTNTTNRIRAARRGNLSGNNTAIITEADNFTRSSAGLFVYSGVGSTMELYDNHGNSNSVATDSADSSAAWDGGWIGAMDNPSDHYQGDLYEILMWDQAADAGERTAALAYATAKWGLVA